MQRTSVQNRPRRKCQRQIDYSGKKRSTITSTREAIIPQRRASTDPHDALIDMAANADSTSKQGMTLNEPTQVGQIRRHVSHASPSRQAPLTENTSAQSLENQKNSGRMVLSARSHQEEGKGEKSGRAETRWQ